ncbi:MAG: N-acetyl-gamma-glutamyl-phosphate reductase [Chloroflexi bacterium]|nr:N-acetyl-gamma-glutamyl-phosphate reductase [Chloroflexota bacterium]
MGKPTIFIDGEAGTTGLQIRARLEGRDDVELVSIAPEQRKDDNERRRLLNSVDLAVLCLPDDAALQSASFVENPAVRILDASTAHRVNPDWTYGFPELLPGQTERIGEARRVAVPGCYATGATALIRPLVDAGLLPSEMPVNIFAVEGYTGGGRKMIDEYEGRGEVKIDDPLRMYGLELRHKHVPEIQLYGGLKHRPLFTPAVGNWRQGMFVQVPLALWALPKQVTGREVHQALAERYEGQRFVRVMPLAQGPVPILEIETLNGTNLMEIFVFENPDDGHVVLIARADNLGKGASGAAVQSMDLMLGLSGDHTYALPADARLSTSV